jgi:hypothetical protein
MQSTEKLLDKMYDMYRSLDDMEMKVFDIYHDWMLSVLDEAREEASDVHGNISSQFNRMSLLHASAKAMNEAMKIR